MDVQCRVLVWTSDETVTRKAFQELEVLQVLAMLPGVIGVGV